MLSDHFLAMREEAKRAEQVLSTYVAAGIRGAVDYFVGKTGKIVHSTTREAYSIEEFSELMRSI